MTVPVWIERIAVEHLGPLGDLTLDLGRLNLIYGRNETGKTYLIEFLLRSLFRDASDWPLRGEQGLGKVTVHGLAEGPVDFTPGGRIKLEDYWEDRAAGLPANMARLLVVKGGELALTEANREGLDRDVLKTALSSEALIDRILESIQATVREAEVVDGRIRGAQRGEIKAQQALRQDLDRLNDLSELVENRYSRGRVRTLELEHDELESGLAQQREAKRHEAYRLHQQRGQVRVKHSRLPKDQLDALARDLGRYLDKQAELGGLHEKWAEVKSAVEHYPWLKEAVGIWERRTLEAAASGSVLSALTAGGLLVLGLVLALIGPGLDPAPVTRAGLAAAAIGSFALGIGLGIRYVLRTRRQAAGAIDLEERSEIEADFKRRFGRPPGGLPGLKAEHEQLRDRQVRLEGLSEDLERTEAEVRQMAAGIERLLRELTGEEIDPEAWVQVAGELRDREAAMGEVSHLLDVRLGELGVDQSDYRPEAAAVEFSAERLRELEGELERVNGELRWALQDLDNLKQEIARETGDEISAAWEHILENLRQRRREAEAEYRGATARILGQIGVSQVLERVRTEEDEKIREGLAAKEVSALLREITGRYHSMDYGDGAVKVLGETADYYLADLSTGAREQVLLALRMGFASRLAGGQPLFMLLDDAFQHSDWERRVRLVEQVLNMVQAGWQVTYLTMDDHLRDLFDTAAKKALDGDYRLHTIEV